MKKRLIKTAPTVPPGAELTRHQAAELARELVRLQTEQEKAIAERDAAILEASAPWATRLDTLARDVEHAFDRLENWANSHLEEFGKAESVLLDGHRVGWRLGNWAAKTAATKITWKKVQEAIEELPAKWRALFLREKVEVNKEALIAARDTETELLKSIGVKVVQERRFYVDPNREGQAEPGMTRDAAA